MTPILQIDDLHIRLPAGADRMHAVGGLSLSIEAGKTLCVVGESGSGKSVLASAVMGLLPKGLAVERGSVRLEGEELLSAPPGRLRGLRGVKMGMVFQEPMTALNPVMRCGEQIDELLRLHTRWAAGARKARVMEVFEQVRLPDPARIYASYPHQLSGGQRQRIVIAMAVALKPRLLICDEPTTALDVTTQREILKLISDLHAQQGSAVLFITHDMGVVEDIADEVFVMREGLVVESGPREEVLRRPTHPYTRELLSAVPGMDPPPTATIPDTPPVLSARNVGKTYVSHSWMGHRTGTVALQDAALRLRARETVGIVGESGSGKSTFARCLLRLTDASDGEIHWGGDEVSRLPERGLRPLRSHIQVIFQDPNRSLNPRRRVGDSIIEGARNFGMSTQAARKRATELMEMVRLPVQALERYPNEFSGGQRQRIAIARALACNPKVLVADEAVSALDVSVQAQVVKLLKELQDEFSIGLLFITHDLRVAAQLCHRIIVMHQGKVVEEGDTSEVYARPRHDYTRTLLEAAPKYRGFQPPSVHEAGRARLAAV
jgi:peptide/nickel transport system ATP-binding protein